jgi:hypothetical protein
MTANPLVYVDLNKRDDQISQLEDRAGGERNVLKALRGQVSHKKLSEAFDLLADVVV